MFPTTAVSASPEAIPPTAAPQPPVHTIRDDPVGFVCSNCRTRTSADRAPQPSLFRRILIAVHTTLQRTLIAIRNGLGLNVGLVPGSQSPEPPIIVVGNLPSINNYFSTSPTIYVSNNEINIELPTNINH